MSEQAAPVTIQGQKIDTPTKLKLAQGVADALGIDRPDQSNGSSVDSTFLDRIHTALTGDESTKSDAYRKVERVLQDLGLTYDPFWDTSESSETGGSTVTNRAYSRILAAVSDVPRCFIVNVNDAEAGERWETDHEFRYKFDSTVSGRRPLLDAGPGSRIVYYATHKHKTNPKHFIAHAEVNYIGPGWTGPWEALITNYTEFKRPVPKDELEMAGWNTQISITEVSYGTYQALLAAGDSEWSAEEETPETDPGGDTVAKRVLDEIPLPDVAPALDVPESLPVGALTPQVATVPTYTEGAPGKGLTTSDLPPAPRNSARNKLAEKRAVDLARQALEAQGWELKRDCQKDGVGYDLLYRKEERELHVEVKGIISNTLAFNLTPKESWRVETDEDFVVLAVTNVLSPHAYTLNLLTRTQLVAAERVITGYRLKF